MGKFLLRKNCRQSPSTTKIKKTKYFLRRIIGVSLYCRVVITTKIKPGEDLTEEIFHRRKIPKLWYKVPTKCDKTLHLHANFGHYKALLVFPSFCT